jgi:hypothetical protein
VGIQQESPLNIDIGINNERQDSKISTEWGYMWEGEVKKRR